MGMVVKNNMSALNTLNIMTKNSSALSKSLAKVSSGMKINSAADDASGYAISEKMRVQIRSLDQANQNTQNGSSLLKVAEGAVSSTVDILKTLKEKVVSSANDTNTTADRQTIQKELNNAIDQINDNASVTFNGKTLVDGSVNSAVKQTSTAVSNEGFQTKTAGASALTDLLTRDGNKVDIKSSDTITVSFVKNAHTYTTSYSVSNTTLADVLKNANKADTEFATASVKLGSSTDDAIKAADQVFNAFAGMKSVAFDANTITIGAAYMTIAGFSADTSTTDGAFSNAGGAAVGTDKDAKANVLRQIETLYTANSATFTKNINAATNLSDDQKTAILNYAEASYGIGAKGAAAAATGTMLDVMSALSVTDTAAMTVSVAGKDYAIAADAVKLSSGGSRTASDSALNGLMDAVKNASQSEVAQMVVTGGKTVADNANLVTALNNYKTAFEKAAAKRSFQENVGSSSVIGTTSTGVTQYTASGESALTFTAANSGIAGQVAGLTLSIKGTDGNVKKSINTLLDNFSETIRAQDKSADNSINLQIGTKASQSIKAGLTDMRGLALGLQGTDKDGNLTTIDVTTREHANAAINVMDSAIQKALDQQTTIGAVESRLEYTSSNLTTASENVTSAESTIRDANIAKEMTEYTKNNILMQASQSMLAQANQSSSGVLSLLQ